MNKTNYFTKGEFNLETIEEGILAFTKDQIKEIRKRTPKKEIEEKVDDDGFKYKTVKGAYVKKKLNLLFGWNFDFDILSENYYATSKEVVVKGKLTIRSNGQTASRTQFGKFNTRTKVEKIGRTTTFGPENIGNAFKSAGTDALKKCASEFGLFWDVYGQPRPEPKKEGEIPEEDKDAKEMTDRLIRFLDKALSIEGIETIVEVLKESHQLSASHEEIIAKYKSKFFK